jgi:pyrroloquinoline quinone biosynthesis protein B
MKIKVLGSAAGGGLPQWNCNCSNCSAVRRGDGTIVARTQSSIAVSSNGEDWLLVNASPDLLTQVASDPELQPARRARDSGVAGVLVTDAQIDHVTGLLMLRERDTPLPLYATAAVWADLNTGFPIGPILSYYCGVDHRLIDLDGTPLTVPWLPGVSIEPLPITSKAPPYSPHREAPEYGDNIGLVFTSLVTGKRALYAPGLGVLEPHVLLAMRQVDVLLVDGTMWSGDEMIRLGLSKKTAADMGHLAQSGPGGMIEVLRRIDGPSARRVRKLLIHINNTNPILNEHSPERRVLESHGIEVATDGMMFEL